MREPSEKKPNTLRISHMGLNDNPIQAHIPKKKKKLKKERKKEAIWDHHANATWFFLLLCSHVLSDLSQRLQITTYYCIHKHTRLFFSITRRHIHNEGLDHHCPGPSSGRVKRHDRPVIVEPVITADDTEADDVALIVEDLEPLGAWPGGESRHHVDLTERAYVAVTVYDVAALDKVLVRLRVVEAADNRPYHRDGRVYGLHHRRTTLIRLNHVKVMLQYRLRYRDPVR